MYKTFEDWMDEIENFSSRRERAEDGNAVVWAKTAWDLQQEKIDKLTNILAKAFPEQSGHYFICGEGGEKDGMNLPERIHVCPTFGLDGFATYKKDKDYDAPGW